MTPQTTRMTWRELNTPTKTVLIVIPALILVFLLTILFANLGNEDPGTQGQAAVADAVVEEDSYVLDDAGEDAPTLVEFLDFECEACGAFYPTVEEIRETYRGEINYVVRYFPVPGHVNSMNAAIAVEAAGQQGEFEAMYNRMFETQTEWGEGQDSEAPRFRGYAEDLGLDMEAYDAAVADPATEERVQKDFDAGVELGVTGTPTFFLDGEQLQLQAPEDLTAAVDEAVNAG